MLKIRSKVRLNCEKACESSQGVNVKIFSGAADVGFAFCARPNLVTVSALLDVGLTNLQLFAKCVQTVCSSLHQLLLHRQLSDSASHRLIKQLIQTV